MNYKDIKNPQDLLKYMNSIEYDDTDILDWKLDNSFSKSKNWKGNCFSQVEFEREWFANNGYIFKTFFIWFQLDVENPYLMHSYLVYEENDKYYYFENADKNNRGIHEFSSYLEAVEYQMKEHLKLNNKIAPLKKEVIECLYVYEFSKPELGIGIEEYLDNILDNGIVWI